MAIQRIPWREKKAGKKEELEMPPLQIDEMVNHAKNKCKKLPSKEYKKYMIVATVIFWECANNLASRTQQKWETGMKKLKL